MQRSTTILLGAFVAAAIGVLLVKGGPRPQPTVMPSWSAALSASSLGVLPPLVAPSIGFPSAQPEVSAVPERKLPANAPRTVHFGVVLVQYRGAQFAREQAPYKPDALQRARQLTELARKDFKEAVQQGDPGSVEDAGRIKRNILEPGVELELFSLAPGAVGGPIDTPRGYWIVRRID